MTERDYIVLMDDLQKEWPPERLHQFTLDYLRESCQWALEKRKELERENKELRQKGVSYKQRQAYTVKINALDSLFNKWKIRGIKYKREFPRFCDIVQPEDIPYIDAVGFEMHLRSALIY